LRKGGRKTRKRGKEKVLREPQTIPGMSLKKRGSSPRGGREKRSISVDFSLLGGGRRQPLFHKGGKIVFGRKREGRRESTGNVSGGGTKGGVYIYIPSEKGGGRRERWSSLQVGREREGEGLFLGRREKKK